VTEAAGFRTGENITPVWFEFDEYGFRKSSDGKNSFTGDIVLMLGDSFTEGAQVEAEQTFGELNA
jgi:hypothetical protein